MDFDIILQIINDISQKMGWPRITMEQLQAKLEDPSPESEAYRKHKPATEWYSEKISLLIKYQDSEIGKLIDETNPFAEVYHFYLHKEDSEEAIRWNEAFIRGLATPEGQAELLRSEISKLTELDLSNFYSEDKDAMLSFYMKDPALCEFMRVCSNAVDQAAYGGLIVSDEIKAFMNKMYDTFKDVQRISVPVIVKGMPFYPVYSGLPEDSLRELRRDYNSFGNAAEDQLIEQYSRNIDDVTSEYKIDPARIENAKSALQNKPQVNEASLGVKKVDLKIKTPEEKLFEAVDTILDISRMHNGAFGMPETPGSDPMFGLSAGRSALSSMAVGVMLLGGASFDDILNPGGPTDDHIKAGKEVLDKYTKGGEELGTYAARAYIAILEKSKEYFEKHFAEKELTSADFTDPSMRNFVNVLHVVQDAVQESERLQKKHVLLENQQQWKELIEENKDGIKRAAIYEDLLKNAAEIYKGNDSPEVLAVSPVLNGFAAGAAIAAERKMTASAPDRLPYAKTGERLLDARNNTANMLSKAGLYKTQKELEAKFRNESYRKQYAVNMLNFDNYSKVFSVELSKDPAKADGVKLEEKSSIVKMGLGLFEPSNKPPRFDIAKAGKDRLMERIAVMTDGKNRRNAHYSLPQNIEQSLEHIPFSLKADRTALATLCLGRLLIKGYRLNDILDGTVSEEIRAEAGREVLDALRKGASGEKEEAEFGRYASEGYLAALREITSYISTNVPGDLSTEQLISLPQHRNLLSMGYLLTDAKQELDRIPRDLKTLTEEQDKELTTAQKSASFILRQYEQVLGQAHALYTGKTNGMEVNNVILAQQFLTSGLPAVKTLVETQLEDKAFTELNDFEASEKIRKLPQDAVLYIDKQPELQELLANTNARQNLAMSMLGSNGQKNLFPSMGEQLGGADFRDAVKPASKQGEATGEYIEASVPSMRKALTLYKTGRDFWKIEKTYSKISVGLKNVYSCERTALQSLTFCDLLARGHSIDEVLDPGNEPLRKEAADRITKRFDTLSEAYQNGALTEQKLDEFNQYAADVYAGAARKFISYLNTKLENGLEFNDLFRPEMKNVMTVHYFLSDTTQDLSEKLKLQTRTISDIDKILTERSSLDVLLMNHRSVMQHAVDILDGNRDNAVYKTEAATNLLPALAATKYANDKIRTLPEGKRPSDIPSKDYETFSLVKDKAGEDLKEQEDELDELLETAEGRHRFIYTVMNGQVGSALFKVKSGEAVTAEFTRDDLGQKHTIIHSNVKTGDLAKAANLRTIKKALAPGEPIPTVVRKPARQTEQSEIQTKARRKEPTQEERKAIYEWFDSLTKELQKEGFETRFSIDSARLKRIDVQQLDDKRIKTFTDFALKESAGRGFEVTQLLVDQPPLSNLSFDETEKLYLFAKQGKLALTARDGHIDKMKCLYVKADGKAGISADIKTIQNEPNAAAERFLPGAVNPELCKKNLINYEYGSSFAEGFYELFDQKTTEYRNIGKAWEAEVMEDFWKHPLYYANDEQAARRSELILNRQILNFVEKPKDMEKLTFVKEPLSKKDRDALLNKHNTAYANDVEDILLRVAEEHYPEFAAQITENTAPDLRHMMQVQMIENLFKNNLIGGPGKTYELKPGDDPWTLLDEVTEDILSDRDVYLMKPNGKFHQIVMGPTDQIPKLKKDPIVKLTKTRKDEIRTQLEESFGQTLRDTTSRDSAFFTRMREVYGDTMDKLGSTDIVMNSATALKDLKKAADDYYFAKLDQSMNSRRSRRVLDADMLRRFEDDPQLQGSDRMKYNIAARAVKSYAGILIKSKNKASVAMGKELMANGLEFKNAVENMFRHEEFKDFCSQKTMPELKKTFEKSGASLAQELFGEREIRLNMSMPKAAEREHEAEQIEEPAINRNNN